MQFLLALFAFIYPFVEKSRRTESGYHLILILLLTIASIVVGWRPIYAHSDTQSYQFFWSIVEQKQWQEKIFYSSMLLAKNIGATFRDYLIFISVIFHILVYYLYSKISQSNIEKLFLLLVFMSTITYESYSSNIIRQGLASTLILFGALRRKQFSLMSILLYVSAILIHNGSILFISSVFGAVLLSLRRINFRFYEFFFLSALMVFLGNLMDRNIYVRTYDFFLNYNRLYFVDYSSTISQVSKYLFTLFGYYIITTVGKLDSGEYRPIIARIYFVNGLIYSVLISIPFSDRIAHYCWFLIPIGFMGYSYQEMTTKQYMPLLFIFLTLNLFVGFGFG